MSLSLTLAEPDSQLLTKKINCSFQTPFSTTFLKFTKILFEETEKKIKKINFAMSMSHKNPYEKQSVKKPPSKRV